MKGKQLDRAVKRKAPSGHGGKGYLGLAVAVLAQAAEDAAAGDEEAREFLLSPEAALMLSRLGLSPAYCQRLVQHPTETAGEWLTVPEAAARCGCHPETVRKRIRSGHLQARGGGRGRGWLVLAESLDYASSTRRT
jgi:hypothetical protein